MIDVSVIVPCYNAEKFLDACIGSIARQTGVSLEILAVDDASTDGTWARLNQLAGSVANLVVERLARNSGQAIARNVAIDRARGRYVALLDSDDAYRSDQVLRRWVDAAEADDLDMCIAQYSTLRPDGRIDRPAPVPPIPGGVGNARTAPGVANSNQSWQVLFRRAFLEQNNLRFSTRLRQREDRLFLVEACLRAERIGVVDLDAIVYRDHPDSTMKRVDYGQLAMFTTQMEIMAGSVGEARAAGRVSADFERANAFTYWRQLLEYWNPLIRRVLEYQIEGHGTVPDAAQVQAVRTYLERLMALTGHVGPLYRDQWIDKPGPADDMKAEAVFDIARIAVAAGRDDVLLRVLQRKPVHQSTLRSLIPAPGYDWAEDAVLHYLKFARSADFVEEPVGPNTPPLSSLVKRVVLHIGQPKTGSSSLQEYLEGQRFAFLDRGVWFPVFGVHREPGIRRHRSPGHLELLLRIVHGNEGAAIGRRLAAEVAALGKPVHTLVLSAETVLSHMIWPQGPRADGTGAALMARIAAALGVDTVEVAMVVRRQDAWFQSYYRELLANPVNPFLSGPTGFAAELHDRGLFDYDWLARDIASSKAVSRLHLESFGRLKAQGGSIPWFLGILGLSPDDFRLPRSLAVNESLTDALAANVRILKLQLPSRATAERIYRQIAADPDIATSSFTLISNADWDEIELKISRELADFDRRFPGEAQDLRPQDDSAALPVPAVLARNEPEHIWLGFRRAGDDETEKSVVAILKEYRYMLHSQSWKLTRPLRTLVKRAKDLRARLGA